MPDLILYRDEGGKIDGLGEKGRRAYEKFVKVVSGLDVGETIKFSYALPRSRAHHRFFFAKYTSLLERQEQFTELDHLLAWVKVGAGHVVFVPGAGGELVALPETINWHRLEEQDFIEFHRAANDFLWTPHALAYLWPHLDEEARFSCIEHWHKDAERERLRRLAARQAGSTA